MRLHLRLQASGESGAQGDERKGAGGEQASGKAHGDGVEGQRRMEAHERIGKSGECSAAADPGVIRKIEG